MTVAVGNLGLPRKAGADVAAKTKPEVTKEGKPEAATEDRTYDLAQLFTKFVFAIMGVIVLGALVVIGISLWQEGADSYQNIKDLLSVLLPVLGTWAGTILAFYFTKENFAAASKSNIELHKALNPVQEKLASIMVTDTMINLSEATTLTLAKAENEYKLTELIAALKGKERLPMLDEQGCVKYLAHRSLMDRFIVDHPTDQANHRLATMVADAETLKMLTGFGVLSQTANLAEAKALMDKSKACSDVFITEDGTKTGKALGWVTNVIVQEQAQL